MKLIDADVLKKDISLNYGSVMDAVIVNRIIDEQKQFNPNEWISVTDRLPESSCRCIIYADGAVEYGYWDEVSSYNFSDGEIHYSKTGGTAFFVLDSEVCFITA